MGTAGLERFHRRDKAGIKHGRELNVVHLPSGTELSAMLDLIVASLALPIGYLRGEGALRTTSACTVPTLTHASWWSRPLSLTTLASASTLRGLKPKSLRSTRSLGPSAVLINELYDITGSMQTSNHSQVLIRTHQSPTK